jgi:hypothetical protein
MRTRVSSTGAEIFLVIHPTAAKPGPPWPWPAPDPLAGPSLPSHLKLQAYGVIILTKPAQAESFLRLKAKKVNHG